MASSAIFLTVVISVIIASTNGFRIENPQAGVKTPGVSGGFFASSESPKTSTYSSFILHQPIAGYPKVPPPNAHEAGGHEDDLLPPLEDAKSEFSNFQSQKSVRRSLEEAKVDPKTGYPLEADPSWKNAGGNEEILELPLEDPKPSGGQEQEAVDPKTGYPLVAQAGWKDAGGDEAILELPLEDSESFDQGQEAVDAKTGYPLVAQPSWKFAGGDGEILQLPVEDQTPEQVDPKTGYPLVAQLSWQDAGGNGEILQLPEEDKASEQVDPKTGYPLVAQLSWQDAGGNEEILELPFEDPADQDQVAVDPKTGYPLVAQPGWKDAGGDGDILDPPIQDNETNQEKVDPKTGYPLVAQPTWKDAGGDGEILQLPVEDQTPEQVDPKTGYPLVAQSTWQDAGGNGHILQLPLEESSDNLLQERLGRVVDEKFLTELRPPPLENKYPTYSTFFFFPLASERSLQQNSGASQNQRRSAAVSQPQFDFHNKPVESSYTYTGPDNVVVTVTRFLSTNKESRQPQQPEPPSHNDFTKNGFTQSQNNVQQVSSTPSALQSSFSIQNNETGHQFQRRRQSTFFQPNNQNYSNFQTRNF